MVRFTFPAPLFRRPVETRWGWPGRYSPVQRDRRGLPVRKTHRPFTLEHALQRHQNAAAASLARFARVPCGCAEMQASPAPDDARPWCVG